MGKSQRNQTVGRGNPGICTSIEWSFLDSKAKHSKSGISPTRSFNVGS